MRKKVDEKREMNKNKNSTIKVREIQIKKSTIENDVRQTSIEKYSIRCRTMEMHNHMLFDFLLQQQKYDNRKKR